MTFAALAGGAECGPVNPLAQLSKAYSNDRGVQQDHFTPQQGSSRNAFRANPQQQQQQPLPTDAARFFQHPSHQQPFDLAPLGRALTPQANLVEQREGSPAPAPPAWATAFAQQSGGPQHGGGGAAEQEAFRRAFGGAGGGGGGQGMAEWSGDFARQQQRGGEQMRMQQQGGVPQQQGAGGMHAMGQARLMGAGFGAAPGMMGMQGMGGVGVPMHYQQQQQQRDTVVQTQTADWETAFRELESSPLHAESIAAVHAESTSTSQAPLRSSSPVLTDSQARDALARTAGALLSTVQSTEQQRQSNSEQSNDKFANSTFLDLMRKLRDGEVAVEGDKVVEQLGPSRGVDKGKGRASGWASEFGREEEGRVGAAPTTSFGISSISTNAEPTLAAFAAKQQAYAQREAGNAQRVRELEQSYKTMAELWEDEDATRELREAKSSASVFQGDGGMSAEEEQERMHVDTSVPLASSAWEEDFDASMISGGHAFNAPRTTERELSAQQKEWDVLQADWDNFDVTASGFKPVASTSSTLAGYGFAQNNPYVQSTRTHSMHTSAPTSNYDSILQKEAAVQQNPNDSAAWLALGIKQQENEREDLAIKALRRAIELDSKLGEAYLALAVSYTNENERALSYEAIDRWVDTLGVERYTREVDNYRDLFGKLPEQGSKERHDYLTGLLIRLAQGRAEVDGADVDAEVQIGLGVLFNTSEEYEKAGDCFESALSVRPDDPLLFNRLGATFANSGKTELAIQYYLEALDIQPGYVRARFNLAVANMNLGQYEEAIQHLTTSLSIQETEAQLEAGNVDNASRGVTSQTLWDSLNICLLQMHRSDLATYTSSRDLRSILAAFPPTHV
ncbi:hypothetical protein BCR35DRAFT_287869 [Leucosporidium creatinivorum]|uniref:Peroxisomal targeting signal receptor n=1 Tax=Leucosporidium creatinivorum TaxID=106004 RepID=A0A1Y2G025_9BASI|nr:hypothetical protein BCR35DRAFT_287869 [Leucosporidium creatinivorum]